MKKHLIFLLTISILLLSLTPILSAYATADVTFNILDIKDSVRTIGRTGETATGIYSDWTASGIEFKARCQGDVSLSIQSVNSDVGNKGPNNKDCYFTVFINGVRQSARLRVMEGVFTVDIATDLPLGDYTFKILKQNEMSTTKAEFREIILDGTILEKPAAEDYVFEFVGDSITSGFGSLDNNNQAQRYSDGTRTYAFLTAQNFGAQARVVSVSGGSINSVFENYKKDSRSATLYDFSLKKPDVFVMAFGTNDGAKTVDYWQNGLKNFADTMRGGYNDYNIPMVFVYALMSNSDTVRSNVAQAMRNLENIDSQKYSKMFVTYGNNPTGGHPAQANHLKNANKLTRDLVDFEIMPETALKSDATVTLSKTSSETTNFHKFDTIVSPLRSGITASLAEPIDPDDAGNTTAKSVTYLADGTQPTTTDYRYPQVRIGSVTNTNYLTKGISFYVNYSDLTDYTGVENPTYSKPQIMISTGDKRAFINLNVQNGVTTKVEILWNTMSDVSYVMSGILTSGGPSISLEMKGACSYTIDNMQVLNHAYQYASNANTSYSYVTGGIYDLIGVTDNYSFEPTTTTSTGTSTSTTTTNTAPTSTSASTTTTSSTQPTTTAPVPGDDNSVVLYNMSEGSRPSLSGTTGLTTSTTYLDLEGNSVLRLTRKQDQAFYFNLPSDIYTKYGIPSKITFDVKTDANVFMVKDKNAMFYNTGSETKGLSVSTISSFDTTWKTVTLDLTSANAASIIENNYTVINVRNAWSSSAQATYIYLDNITFHFVPAVKHTVILDGVSHLVSNGDNFVFPVNTNNNFLAYTNSAQYFKAGESVEITQDCAFNSVNLELTMSLGASLRYNQISGLRYYTNIDTQKVDTLREAGFEIELGTLIAPLDLIPSQDLTLSVEESKKLIVPFVSTNWYIEDEFKGFVGTISNVKDHNANRDFVGRGFAVVSFEDTVKTIYANYNDSNIQNNTRTISWIANRIFNDVVYVDLLPAQKTVVDKYNALYIVK